MVLSHYFQLGPIPANALHGVYDYRLVLLSYLVAVFASYVALDLAGRLRDINNSETSRRLWLIGGSVAMGAGIWSMHFIGMLSFSIPGLAMQYGLFWTIISLAVAIAASGFALMLLKSSAINMVHLIAGGIILGLGIAAMHYTGMEAMLVNLNMSYLPSLFILSIFIAIIASISALWLAIKSNTVILRMRSRVKLASALIMGLAICGMHYTGMAASVFYPIASPHYGHTTLDPAILAMAIAGVTFVILGIAFYASSYNEAINQQQLEKARQLGVAEVSASVLHNVGNVLNSVNVSANIISEKISTSKLSGIEKLSLLLKEHKNNLATFLTEDPKGSRVTDFINSLAEYWHEEKSLITKELDSLLKNITLIKSIISTQQTISKITELEEIISINDLLDEALLIIGLNFKADIKIEKHYSKLKPIQLDKTKLLQVIINVLRNAKDAVMKSKKDEKRIRIRTMASCNKKNIIIEVSDNGIGISSKMRGKIFCHGFTTKESGHGFGLHASALTMNELGGKIYVKSEGLEKGTTFILEIPNRVPLILGWMKMGKKTTKEIEH